MIHRLRRRHRRVWLALAVLLPLLYVIALAARRPPVVIESLPSPLRAADEGSAGAGGAAAPPNQGPGAREALAQDEQLTPELERAPGEELAR